MPTLRQASFGRNGESTVPTSFGNVTFTLPRGSSVDGTSMIAVCVVS